jgi:phosphatidate cytidylyltransferase
LKQRVISAVVLLTVSFTCVLLSPITRVLFFALAGVLCAYEYSKNVEKLDAACTLWVMILYLVLHAICILLDLDILVYIAAFVLCLYLALFSGVIYQKVSGKGALYTLAGLCYPCLLFAVIMSISVCDIWLQTLVLGCLATWVCDSFALFGGMLFGKHKVAPHVSPNKTIEGCVCGAVSSVLTGLLVYWLSTYYLPMPLWLCVVTALVASTMGQIGDLAESLIKRMIGVKDFSNLIPGHGGMFDRADSLLFSIPTAYICLRLAGM